MNSCRISLLRLVQMRMIFGYGFTLFRIKGVLFRTDFASFITERRNDMKEIKKFLN